MVALALVAQHYHAHRPCPRCVAATGGPAAAQRHRWGLRCHHWANERAGYALILLFAAVVALPGYLLWALVTYATLVHRPIQPWCPTMLLGPGLLGLGRPARRPRPSAPSGATPRRPPAVTLALTTTENLEQAEGIRHMAETGHQRKRVVAHGEQLEDRSYPVTVWLVAQQDGSWLLEGLGERPVRLPRDAMLAVAQAVLRRARQSPQPPAGEPSRGDERGDWRDP